MGISYYCFDQKRSDFNLLLCFREKLRQLVIERRRTEFNLTLSKSVIQKGQTLSSFSTFIFYNINKFFQ